MNFFSIYNQAGLFLKKTRFKTKGFILISPAGFRNLDYLIDFHWNLKDNLDLILMVLSLAKRLD